MFQSELLFQPTWPLNPIRCRLPAAGADVHELSMQVVCVYVCVRALSLLPVRHQTSTRLLTSPEFVPFPFPLPRHSVH